MKGRSYHTRGNYPQSIFSLPSPAYPHEATGRVSGLVATRKDTPQANRAELQTAALALGPPWCLGGLKLQLSTIRE